MVAQQFLGETTEETKKKSDRPQPNNKKRWKPVVWQATFLIHLRFTPWVVTGISLIFYVQVVNVLQQYRGVTCATTFKTNTKIPQNSTTPTTPPTKYSLPHLDRHLFSSLGVDREFDFAERAFSYGLANLVLSHLKSV